MFISPGGQFGRGYVTPRATRHIVQSSLKVQDGLFFFFKMESARSVPFLPQKKTVLSTLNGLCSLSETEVLSPGLCPHFET